MNTIFGKRALVGSPMVGLGMRPRAASLALCRDDAACAAALAENAAEEAWEITMDDLDVEDTRWSMDAAW